MRRPTLRPLLVACAAVFTVAACRERVVEPEALTGPAATELDSAAIVAPPPPRPDGLLLAPVGSDSMVLAMDTDSFTVQLTSRECAAPNNWVVLTSPALDTLSSTMCQEPVDTVWSFTDGPYSAGTAIVLDFESGVSGYDGQVQFSDTLPVAFPQWNLEFEDAGDNDFNDFLLRVQAYPDTAILLVADTTELHPWIDNANFLTDDSIYTQVARVGDTTTVTLAASAGATPPEGDTITVTAELVPPGGGHAHYSNRLRFTDLPTEQYSPSPPQRVGGYFKDGAIRMDSLTVVTDSLGKATFAFVAGFLGGRVDLIATGSIGGKEVSDTLGLVIRVPDLLDLTQQGSLPDSVHFVGVVDPHPSDSIWYASPEWADTLRALVAMVSDPGQDRYLGINDNSLPWGGSFSTEPNLVEVSTGNEVDVPNVSHHSHAMGVDADIPSCFYASDGREMAPEQAQCGPEPVDERLMRRAGERFGVFVFKYAIGGNYHIRLGSEVVASERNENDE